MLPTQDFKPSMLLLTLYALTALVFSFLCSIAEAVMLSVSSTHIAMLEKDDKPVAPLLRRLKRDIDQPLAAILTLNTIAHTIGAAGVGAQAAAVFGSASVGISSAILTLLILVFSEIIPKTLGAHYWRQLAPLTAYGLRLLITLLYPFVKLSQMLTRQFAGGASVHGLSRSEFAVMAELSANEGQLAPQESQILQNLLLLSDIRAKDVMTPRTVVFSADETLTVADFLSQQDQQQFSRIPLYAGSAEHVNGFVLRSDLLLAQAQGEKQTQLRKYRREMPVTLDSMAVSQVLDEFIRVQTQIMLVVDEYGVMKGIITLEDVLETLLGLEIVDESDYIENMQRLARKLWKQRARRFNLDATEQRPR